MSSRNKSDVKKLFEYWCEVSKPFVLNKDSVDFCLDVPGVITENFPENFRDIKTITEIPAFAFPCDFIGDSVQSYSFVLTTDDSKWRFGFCRHDPKTMTTMVIITFLPWHDIFLKFLTVLAEVKRLSQDDLRQFLNEAYTSAIPDFGGHLKLVYGGGRSEFIFERPKQFQLPSIPENHNLNLYYNFVDPKNMIAVFAAMLAERRIIFTSRRLDRLSSCIQAANAFLYPMVWQHIFIPILPMKLKDYLMAPMPYLIGVPQIVLETMLPEELGEVVILNCDTKVFESPFNDVQSLPPNIVSQLKKQLNQPQQHMGDCVSKIFLGVLVQLIGGYRDAVEFRSTGKTFNSEKFIESRPPHLRSFLTKMMQLQIFQQFIDERLEMMNIGLGFSDEFEQETVRYAEKLKKRSRFYQLKEKTNPAVKSAVKSVKESSRLAKYAYKDLKSKFREITPVSTQNSYFRSHIHSNMSHDRNNYYDIKPSVGGRIHHSAPSSPLFGKRRDDQDNMTGDFFYTGERTEMKMSSGTSPSHYLLREPTSLSMATTTSHLLVDKRRIQELNTNKKGIATSSATTISPSNSLGSSEMNLSQELQNHPLFKKPIVDRRLKPYHSLEANQRIETSAFTRSCSNSRIKKSNQMPLRPPPPATHLVQHYRKQNIHQTESITKDKTTTNKKQHYYPNSATTSTKATNCTTTYKNEFCDMVKEKIIIPNKIEETVCNRNNNNNKHNSSNSSTSTSFPIQNILGNNTPNYTPIMAASTISPPIPPRRHSALIQQNNMNVEVDDSSHSGETVISKNVSNHLQIHLSRNCDNWRQLLSTSNHAAKSMHSFENRLNSLPRKAIPKNSTTCSASFTSISTPYSFQNENGINSRSVSQFNKMYKEREDQHFSEEGNVKKGSNLPSVIGKDEHQTKDLISLEDVNSPLYLELKDFDPLNQNARPLQAFFHSNVHNSSNVSDNKSAINFGLNPITTTTTTVKSCSNHYIYNARISNPVYTYYASHDTQQQNKSLANYEKPPPLPQSAPPRLPPASPDDDYELLRKYGLDQFSVNTASTPVQQITSCNNFYGENCNDKLSLSTHLNTTTKQGNGLVIITTNITTTTSTTTTPATKAKSEKAAISGMENWTTFD